MEMRSTFGANLFPGDIKISSKTTRLNVCKGSGRVSATSKHTHLTVWWYFWIKLLWLSICVNPTWECCKVYQWTCLWQFRPFKIYKTFWINIAVKKVQVMLARFTSLTPQYSISMKFLKLTSRKRRWWPHERPRQELRAIYLSTELPSPFYIV